MAIDRPTPVTPTVRTPDDKKLISAGLSAYEASLKQQEKLYSISMARRAKVYEKYSIASFKSVYDLEVETFERTEAELKALRERQLNEKRKEYQKDREANKDNAKKLAELDAKYARERADIESETADKIAEAKYKMIAAENAYHGALLESEIEIKRISELFQQNYRKRLPITERLKIAEETVADATKDHREALAMLEVATSEHEKAVATNNEAVAKANKRWEENRAELALANAALSGYQARIEELSNKEISGASLSDEELDEWVDLQQSVAKVQLTISSLNDEALTGLSGSTKKALDEATAEANAALEKMLSSIDEQFKVRQAAMDAKAGIGVSDFVNQVTKDIESNKSIEAELRIRLEEAAANEDDASVKVLSAAIERLSATIDSQEKSVKVRDDSDKKGKKKLTEVGEGQAKEKGKAAAEEAKKALAKKQDEKAQKKAENQAFKDEGGKEAEKALRREEYKEKSTQGLKEALVSGIDGLKNALASYTKAIDSDIDSYYKYQASIEGRLQGSTESYKDLLQTVNKNVAISTVVTQKEVIANIKTLVETGVAYNVDLRAFLQTVSEDIAATFNAFDANLLRLIRIQQADSTAARLGMEATLTKLFNREFMDTSYLAESISDSVAGAILGASSIQDKKESLEFEYTVQKWLGTMYSVGVSSDAVNKIAEALNYLGTGEIDKLTADESMLNLMTMSASRVGLSVADLALGNALSADDTNKLLKSMIEYLIEIATNTDSNQVTKAAYSNLFGMTTTDLSALSNLNADVLKTVQESTLTFEEADKETMNQIGLISKRTHTSQVVNNLIENLQSSAAIGIGNVAPLYTLWKATNIIDDLTGGINIPGITINGFGITSEINTLELVKLGLAGAGMLSSLLGGGGGSLGGMADLNSWGYETVTTLGKGRKTLKSGVQQGTSEREEVSGMGNASSDDVTNSNKDKAKEDAMAEAGTSAEEMEEGKEIPKQTLEALATDSTNVVTEILTLNGALIPWMPGIEGSVEGLLGDTTSMVGLLNGTNAAISNMLTGTTSAIGATTSAVNDLIADTTSMSTGMLGYLGDISSKLVTISAGVGKSALSGASAAVGTLTSSIPIPEVNVDVSLSTGGSSNNVVNNGGAVTNESNNAYGLAISEAFTLINDSMLTQTIAANNYVSALEANTLALMATSAMTMLAISSADTLSNTASDKTISALSITEESATAIAESLMLGSNYISSSIEEKSGGSTSGSSSTAISTGNNSISSVASQISEIYSQIITDTATNMNTVNAEGQSNNSSVTNSSGMSVSLTDITPVKDALSDVMSTAVSTAFGATVSGQGNTVTLRDILKQLLEETTVGVSVKNDNFDTVMTSLAYNNT